MSDVPSREAFEAMYAGKAPWDIGRPQRAFVEVADPEHSERIEESGPAWSTDRRRPLHPEPSPRSLCRCWIGQGRSAPARLRR